MTKTILLLSTMDTKGQETLYLKEKIQSLGINTLLMDLAMRGKVDSQGDVTPAQVAEAGGSTLEKVQSSKERAEITNVFIRGASRISRELYEEGKVHGVLGLGGSTGTLMATDVMRALPFGLPKLVVSSTAALPGLSTRYIGTGDIALFHSVIEISGVSDPLKNVLDRAAYAMQGMVEESVSEPQSESGKAIAMTMLGPCETCASSVRMELEREGFQVIGFSAAGIGDRAMEEMITQGLFQGIVDLAPGGVGEHLFGFMRDAGPHRMESAGKAGIPQIISTCSVNHMTPSKRKYKPDYQARRKYDLDKFRTWLRMSPEELREVAKVFAEKLNGSKGPVRIMIPIKGWSSVDAPGNATYDPGEDRIFIEELQKNIRSDIEIIEVDANMEDPEFASAVVKAALSVF